MQATKVAILFLFVLLCNTNQVRAEQSSGVKRCRDDLQLCKSNYSEKTCQINYEVCLKAFQRK